jgi:rhodanese-related sulfurtransferase
VAEAAKGPQASIAPAELRAAIESGRAPVVLDVRSADEYRAGHVPGAVNVPYWRLLVSVPPPPANRSAPLVVYCGLGPRARVAMAGLRLRGFADVRDLAGHWTGWQRLDFPVTRGDRP